MAQYIYGKNAVRNALESKDRVIKLFTLKGNKEYERHNLKTIYTDKNELAKLCASEHHQGIVAEVNEYKTIALDEMIQRAKSSEYPLLIILDELSDPHNLGAILRSADAIGANGIIYKKNNSVSLNQTVAKVASGAIETVAVSEVVNLSACIKTLKQNGYWVVGTDVNKASDYRSLDYQMPVCLVIGSEGKGISRLVKENCDLLIKLPMLGTVGSLNASVAAGIIMYEIHNQRYPYKK